MMYLIFQCVWFSCNDCNNTWSNGDGLFCPKCGSVCTDREVDTAI